MGDVDTNVLIHNAKNGFGVKFNGYFREEDDAYFLYEKGTNKKIAYIDFDVLDTKKVVFINDMENYKRNSANPYTGIGHLLHEFVRYYMASKKLDYGVQMTIAHSSHAFHYKCGYRFISKADNQTMEALIQQGNNACRNKGNLAKLPESMSMSKEDVRKYTERYAEQIEFDNNDQRFNTFK